VRHARRVGTIGMALAVFGAAPVQSQVLSGGLFVANPSSRITLDGALEETDGLWFGGVIGVEYGRVAFVASGARGELTPNTSGSAIDRDVGKISAHGSLTVLEWLDADVEYAARAFSTVVGRQRWDMLGIGATVRHRVRDTGVTAFYRAQYVPVVNVDDQENPDLSIAAEVGLRVPLGRLPLEVAASYRIERFDFPDRAGSRTDQFQYFQIYLGMKLRRAGGRWVVGGS